MVSCGLCTSEVRPQEIFQYELIQPAVAAYLRGKHPNWREEGICLSCLNHARAGYVADMLRAEETELTKLQEEVINSLAEQETLSRNVNAQFESELTLGERLADRTAAFGGSWRFLIAFALVLTGWILFNGASGRPFDPFPFILLNLILSCLAAVQAPIIMMSQNRQEAKDRLRAENDYRVNLKAELEIRHLNMKIDQLLSHQWRRLLEIQQIQMDLMEQMERRAR
jgi:uncharacterized membrane protein